MTSNEEIIVINDNKSSKNNNISSKKSTKMMTLDYISLVKVIAAFSTVISYCNSFYYRIPNKDNRKYWRIANFIDTLLYIAYPSFYLCMGAILLNFNEKYGIGEYYKKRVKKMVIPFLCWNFILFIYKVYILKDVPKNPITFKYIWNLIFEFKLNFIFKSIRSFLIVYMIIPSFAYVEKENKIKVYLYFIFILFIFQILIPYFIKMYDNSLSWPFDIEIKYIVYVLSGYLIHNHYFSRNIKIVIYISGLMGFLIMFIGTEILSIRDGELNNLHKYYLSLPCYIYSCSSFLFIKEYSELCFKIIKPNFINKISELIMGPFLLHIPIMDTFRKLLDINEYGFKFRFLGTITILNLSLFIAFVFTKIPVLKYLIPKFE